MDSPDLAPCHCFIAVLLICLDNSFFLLSCWFLINYYICRSSFAIGTGTGSLFWADLELTSPSQLLPVVLNHKIAGLYCFIHSHKRHFISFKLKKKLPVRLLWHIWLIATLGQVFKIQSFTDFFLKKNLYRFFKLLYYFLPFANVLP